jgi:hypothetical protein
MDMPALLRFNKNCRICIKIKIRELNTRFVF